MAAWRDQRDLAVAAARTWGGRGAARRVAYEAARRTGRIRAAEDRWLAAHTAPAEPFRPTGAVTAPGHITAPDATLLRRDRIALYGGGIEVDVPSDGGWHLHPITGHRYDRAAHWSTISDAVVEVGDIKDVWEPARLGWLQPWLRHWAATGDHEAVGWIWGVVADWHAGNPPYRGPGWRCGQETALRTIGVMLLGEALDASPATADEHRRLVAGIVRDAVGRVEPTLGYALSQRNNHASSEAGFLWTASILAPWLPRASRLRDRAARALTEVVADQFARDGSYAQHSPTYHRVALHVLLWCLAVSRATGEPAPDGVAEAVARSVSFLRGLVAPGSGGRVPNLGGNDGALIIDLAPASIDDLRPVIAHAAAATGQASGYGPGPWDEEAAWFGLTPLDAPPATGSDRIAAVGGDAVTTHALTRGEAHAVLRAGTLRHRPAHADQLHVDVWLCGTPVAVDAGSYRYVAQPPWDNALAGEDVHNLPTVAGAPQAERRGRFFWSRWAEAEVRWSHDTPGLAARLARLTLGDQVVTRLVIVADGVVAVVDEAAPGPAEVRWNLLGTAEAHDGATGRASAAGPGWRAAVRGGAVRLRTPDDADPASGWHSPTYGRREPLTATITTTDRDSRVASVFATDTSGIDPGEVIDRLGSLHLRGLRAAAVEEALSRRG